jgi:MYXO-CTERM domain-containing protein
MRRAASIVILSMAATSARADWSDGVDIYKVFLGAYPDPNAFYVVLDVSEGDNFILYSKLLIYARGSEGVDEWPYVLELYDHVATGEFALIANDAAESLFDITADLQLELPLRRDGGKLCFDGRGGVDCVAWGDYDGPTEGVGTPFNAPNPPELSTSILRKAPGPVADSSEGFEAGDPWPINIWGETGFTPLIRCGDGVVDPGEQCDEGPANSNGTPGACRADCTLQSPVDAGVDGGEDGGGGEDGSVPVDAGDDGGTPPVDACVGDCMPEPPPPPTGCGSCRAGGAAPVGDAWLFVLGVLAAARRRRKQGTLVDRKRAIVPGLPSSGRVRCSAVSRAFGVVDRRSIVEASGGVG